MSYVTKAFVYVVFCSNHVVVIYTNVACCSGGLYMKLFNVEELNRKNYFIGIQLTSLLNYSPKYYYQIYVKIKNPCSSRARVQECALYTIPSSQYEKVFVYIEHLQNY
jgi:hypothetical protein